MKIHSTLIFGMILCFKLYGMQDSPENLANKHSADELYKLNQKCYWQLVHTLQSDPNLEELLSKKECFEQAMEIKGLIEEGITRVGTAKGFREELEKIRKREIIKK